MAELEAQFARVAELEAQLARAAEVEVRVAEMTEKVRELTGPEATQEQRGWRSSTGSPGSTGSVSRDE